MTAFELQDDLIEELRILFTGFLLMTPAQDEDGNTILSELHIFSQSLPIKVDDNQMDDPYPYIIVRVESGTIKGDESPHEVKVRLLIGTYDEKTDSEGHRDILNVIQKIYERFAKSPVLANKYVMKNEPQSPFNWALQDEDTYPYYFGAIEVAWETRAIRRESPYT